MTDEDYHRATCYHEAAHAVFAVRVCDGRVRYVDADEAYCAADFPVFRGWANSWRAAMYALAGRFAEQLEGWGETKPESWEEFSEGAEMEAGGELVPGDSYDLMESLREMGDPEEEYRIVVEDTEQHVRELWPHITAVAEALVVRRRLEGDEVARLIETVDGKGGA